MMSFFYVALGGALGAAMRHGVNLAALRLVGPGFPVGTLLVNLAGSLAMGVLIGWLARRNGIPLLSLDIHDLRALLATGVLGGFTTFSAFALDALTIWERGQAALALAYVLASVVLSIAAVMVGLALVRGV